MTIYLSSFDFPDDEKEFDYCLEIKRKCYDTFYPFKVLSYHHFDHIDFAPITILYGGNGCGKTTALNIIAEKLSLKRTIIFNQSNFFTDYVNLCHAAYMQNIPSHSCIITSDDVFDYMLNIRQLNQGIDQRREELFDEYLDNKHSQFKLKSINDYEKLCKVNLARTKTQSQYVRKNVMDNIIEHSNGENAFMYFTQKIGEDGLYLLDEPENSLSPEKQLDLLRFLEDSARFFGCQFIISTHSPFLLSMKEARIYNLDEDPVCIRKWTELKNVQIYYQFFKNHEKEF